MALTVFSKLQAADEKGRAGDSDAGSKVYVACAEDGSPNPVQNFEVAFANDIVT
jgi:hypothetical protein